MLSENLKKIMEQKKMSRLEVACKSGLSPRTIEFIELGKTESPQLDTVQKIAKALGVALNDLIS